MPNLLTVIFTAAKMQELMDQNPDKIAVRVELVADTLSNNTEAGVVKVYGDARQNNTPEPLATVSGCPFPPCSVDD